MSRLVGDSDRFPCITNETTTDPQHYCSGSMNATYGGECDQICRCGGQVTITQYMNCCCNQCGTHVAEVFEYCCNDCSNYGLSDRFTVYDPDNDCRYSWVGIGYPLAEAGDVEQLMSKAINKVEQIIQTRKQS